MKWRIIQTLVFLFIVSNSLAQDTDVNRKAIYIELAGSGGFGSINYERAFYSSEALELNGSLGFSFSPIDRNNGAALIFPIKINSLIGAKAHKFEAGLGQGLTITTKGSPFALATVNVGYRYQSPASNWFYRIAYTPLVSYLVDFQVQQWAGISIGYNLNS